MTATTQIGTSIITGSHSIRASYTPSLSLQTVSSNSKADIIGKGSRFSGGLVVQPPEAVKILMFT